MAEVTNGSKTHTLTAPVTITRKAVGSSEEKTETITVLHFRKPQGKDFRALDRAEGGIGKAMALAAQIADVPELVIDKLDPEDFFKVLEIASGFLPESLRTGATS